MKKERSPPTPPRLSPLLFRPLALAPPLPAAPPGPSHQLHPDDGPVGPHRRHDRVFDAGVLPPPQPQPHGAHPGHRVVRARPGPRVRVPRAVCVSVGVDVGGRPAGERLAQLRDRFQRSRDRGAAGRVMCEGRERRRAVCLSRRLFCCFLVSCFSSLFVQPPRPRFPSLLKLDCTRPRNGGSCSMLL